ncbi:MAG: hypothetical protein Q4D82_01200 [Neisseria sp.]|nr:hypothetical protein [Neisseria sp.]
MSSLPQILLRIAVLIAVFYAGMRVQAFLYEDWCLDMGGGKNPGDYPVCVIEHKPDNALQEEM